MIAKTRHVGDVTVVEIAGRFDAVSAPKDKAQLHEMIESGSARLVVNLEAMDFIDSAGLGALVSSLRWAAAAGGDLRLAAVPPSCRPIFELTRLTRVFDITQSEEQAIGALAEPRDAEG